MKGMLADKQFLVALSFPGEHRSFVQKVADALAAHLGRERIFYDKWYEAELARLNLDTHLQAIYREQSQLIAVFLCHDYARKEWCGLEWRAIRELIKQKQDSAIMPFRFDETEIPGLFSFDGYISLLERSPEEVADLILQRLASAEQARPEQPQIEERSLVISSSGEWIMLNWDFFKADAVKTSTNGTIVARFLTTTSAEDAVVRSLRRDQFHVPGPISFAHRNDGLVVLVSGLESESRGEGNLWTMELKPIDVQYGGSFVSDIAIQGYTADDIATLRAKRILLNAPPALPETFRSETKENLNGALLESLIAGINNPIRVKECPLQQLYSKLKTNEKQYLEIARLAAVFTLKAGGVVEHVLDLTLGPLRNGKLHVRFRGQRRKVYVNKEAFIIAVEGDCPLG